jgi:glycosyltransferase involved in cell wall biosynthesis
MAAIADTFDDPATRDLIREPFDLIHGHFGPRILHAAAFLKRGIPMVLSTYGYDVGRLLRDSTWIERYRWAASQGVVFAPLAQSMERRLLALGLPPKNIRRINLGIDLAVHPFDPRPAPPTPRFVFIGRFVDKKGADTLIDAMHHLIRDHHTPAKLDLIGAGPNESALRAQVERADLSDQINFLGLVPFAELFDHLRDCTALVQPSQVAPDGDAEGAPMVLMTAQAAGVPYITTHHSGNPETIPPIGQAFVVPERDPIALADAMRRMIDQSAPDRSILQAAGRRWIEENYDLQKTIAQYAALYRELM